MATYFLELTSNQGTLFFNLSSSKLLNFYLYSHGDHQIFLWSRSLHLHAILAYTARAVEPELKFQAPTTGI